MKNHMLWMMIGCFATFFIISLLPLAGITAHVGLLLIIVFAAVCCVPMLLMMWRKRGNNKGSA
jgi:membrane protein implicated in regulation of membrane protease activity